MNEGVHADRFREAELTIAGLVQRVNDHENDYRVFAPMVTEQALMRKSLEDMGKSLDGAHDAIRKLDERLDTESRERREGQQKRKEELEGAIAERTKEMTRMELERDKQHKEMRAKLIQATIALVGVFLTSGAAVLAAILGGH